MGDVNVLKKITVNQKKDTATKRYTLKHAQIRKLIGKWFEKNAWSLHLIMLKCVVFF